MSSLDSVHCWGNLDLSLMCNWFFFIKFICRSVGGFAAEVMKDSQMVFRSSLSLSNVLSAVCLSLSTVRPSHLSWLTVCRSGPLQMQVVGIM